MNKTNDLVLFGGLLGTDEEICLNSKSLGEALLNALNHAGQRIVLVDGISGEEISGNELKSKAIRLALYLQQHYRIRAGDVISICSENRIEFAVTIHAILLLGATLAPLNHSYIEDEMNHAINLSKPKIIFVSPLNLDKISIAIKKHPFVKQIIVYDYGVKTSQLTKVLSFTRIIESIDNAKVNKFECEPQNVKENVALILCSSGTTGLPKGVQLTQFNLFVANEQVNIKRTWRSEEPSTGERVILGNLPMFHAFCLSVFITESLNPLSKFVLIPRFVEKDFLNCIQTYKITTLFLVPPIILFLAKSPLVENYDLTSVLVVIYGSAPASAKVTALATSRTGIKVFRQGYGMTEGTYAFLLQNENHTTEGSAGVLLNGIHGRVVDIDSGKCLGPNQTGELQFKGPNIMKGYIGNEKATSETIDTDGWLHTGDVGYYNENGEWYIVDRIKELIKYNSFQVPPAEIERLLLTHSKIKDAAVIGIPDDVTGEKAFAFIVKQPEVNLTEKDVIDFVAGRLSNAKRLHGGVKFIDEIPKNLSGKILRRTLRDMAINLKSKL